MNIFFIENSINQNWKSIKFWKSELEWEITLVMNFHLGQKHMPEGRLFVSYGWLHTR
jgi:hypothetical protein